MLFFYSKLYVVFLYQPTIYGIYNFLNIFEYFLCFLIKYIRLNLRILTYSEEFQRFSLLIKGLLSIFGRVLEGLTQFGVNFPRSG